MPLTLKPLAVRFQLGFRHLPPWNAQAEQPDFVYHIQVLAVSHFFG